MLRPSFSGFRSQHFLELLHRRETDGELPRMSFGIHLNVHQHRSVPLVSVGFELPRLLVSVGVPLGVDQKGKQVIVMRTLLALRQRLQACTKRSSGVSKTLPLCWLWLCPRWSLKLGRGR